MATTGRSWQDIIREEGRFPYPREIGSVPGTEGWERMYPNYWLFAEDRREFDEKQFWFQDKMHWMYPEPAFDLITAVAAYSSLSSYTTRVFAIPPANGLVIRVLNGYVYAAPQAVTDPAIMEERGPLFARRSAFYFENWNDLYDLWVPKMTAVIDGLNQLQFKDMPKYEDDSVVLEHKGVNSIYTILESYSKLILAHYKAWQIHFEFLNLVYLSYLMFYGFCKKAFPEISDNTIAKMLAGAPGLMMFQPDVEMTKLARLALYLGVADVFTAGLSADETIAEMNKSDQGKRWLEAMENAKDPWFYTSSGGGFYHFDRAWIDDLSIPFGHIRGYIEKVKRGESIDRPVDAIIAERGRLIKEYRDLLPTEDDKHAFDQTWGTLAMAYPYAENHIFYVEHWCFSVFWNKARELGQVLANAGFFKEADDIFLFYHSDIIPILEDLVSSWAQGPGIPPRGPGYWPKEVEWRKDVLKKLGEWAPPPGLGPVPETITEPFTIQLWGITKETLDTWLAPMPKAEEVNQLKGFAASSGTAEGPARVILRVEQLNELQAGEILVCPVTSPSWAPAFLKIKAAVTDLGGMSCHASIVCREYGLPAVVGTGYATTTIKNGDKLKVDGTAGIVTIER